MINILGWFIHPNPNFEKVFFSYWETYYPGTGIQPIPTLKKQQMQVKGAGITGFYKFCTLYKLELKFCWTKTCDF
jgi:hypothetical protein